MTHRSMHQTSAPALAPLPLEPLAALVTDSKLFSGQSHAPTLVWWPTKGPPRVNQGCGRGSHHEQQWRLDRSLRPSHTRHVPALRARPPHRFTAGWLSSLPGTSRGSDAHLDLQIVRRFPRSITRARARAHTGVCTRGMRAILPTRAVHNRHNSQALVSSWLRSERRRAHRQQRGERCVDLVRQRLDLHLLQA